jgi:hypothetical protein
MFIFGVITMTHLERLERGLAHIQKNPDGPGSLYEQDLKAQIAAAKWQIAQENLSPSELAETYFGGTISELNSGETR